MSVITFPTEASTVVSLSNEQIDEIQHDSLRLNTDYFIGDNALSPDSSATLGFQFGLPGEMTTIQTWTKNAGDSGTQRYTVSELEPDTQYSFRPVISYVDPDGFPQVIHGDIRTATTYPSPPDVTTLEPTNIGDTSADLNLAYDTKDHGELIVRFQFSKVGEPFNSYGSALVQGQGVHTHTIYSLDPETEYRYRAVIDYWEGGDPVSKTGETITFYTEGDIQLVEVDTETGIDFTIIYTHFQLGTYDDLKWRVNVTDPLEVTSDWKIIDESGWSHIKFQRSPGPAETQNATITYTIQYQPEPELKSPGLTNYEESENKSYFAPAIQYMVDLNYSISDYQSVWMIAEMNITDYCHGNLRFQYRELGGSWTYMDWEMHTPPMDLVFEKFVSGLPTNKTYEFVFNYASQIQAYTYSFGATFTLEGPPIADDISVSNIGMQSANLKGYVDLQTESQVRAAFRHRVEGEWTYTENQTYFSSQYHYQPIEDIENSEDHEFQLVIFYGDNYENMVNSTSEFFYTPIRFWAREPIFITSQEATLRLEFGLGQFDGGMEYRFHYGDDDTDNTTDWRTIFPATGNIRMHNLLDLDPESTYWFRGEIKFWDDTTYETDDFVFSTTHIIEPTITTLDPIRDIYYCRLKAEFTTGEYDVVRVGFNVRRPNRVWDWRGNQTFYSDDDHTSTITTTKDTQYEYYAHIHGWLNEADYNAEEPADFVDWGNTISFHSLDELIFDVRDFSVSHNRFQARAGIYTSNNDELRVSGYLDGEKVGRQVITGRDRDVFFQSSHDAEPETKYQYHFIVEEWNNDIGDWDQIYHSETVEFETPPDLMMHLGIVLINSTFLSFGAILVIAMIIGYHMKSPKGFAGTFLGGVFIIGWLGLIPNSLMILTSIVIVTLFGLSEVYQYQIDI